MEQLGLYIHIPFCQKKCYYCDFNSYPDMHGLIPEYMDCIIREMEVYSHGLKNRQLASVYMGGGTPTLIPVKYLEDTFSYIMKLFNVPSGSEITVEANPGTLGKEVLHVLKASGANRLSIGLQAWQDELLKRIGRVHTRSEFLLNYHMAREAGFDNINTDIIFGLPGQTLKQWEETLINICRLGVEHISCYGLKVEPGTVLHAMKEHGDLNLPDDGLERDMCHMAAAALKNRGYIHYEISNYSMAGRHSIHNMLYWKNRQYIGIGAGAHGYIDSYRYSNVCGIHEYMERLTEGHKPIEHKEFITGKTRMNDFVMLGLRLIEGIDKNEFQDNFSTTFHQVFGNSLGKLKNMGLIKEDDKNVRLTRKGLDLCNAVLVELLP